MVEKLSQRKEQEIRAMEGKGSGSGQIVSDVELFQQAGIKVQRAHHD
jgi:hypothetical protein